MTSKQQLPLSLIRLSLPTFLFGLLVGCGGLMGYLKGHSIPSLIAGTSSFFLLACCAYGMQQRSKKALYSTLVITLALDAFFMYRFISTFKLFPQGIFSLISLSFLVFLIFNIKNTYNLSSKKQ